MRRALTKEVVQGGRLVGAGGRDVRDAGRVPSLLCRRPSHRLQAHPPGTRVLALPSSAAP
eukprot:3397587-Rhodomonas_salina.4